jgi:integrase
MRGDGRIFKRRRSPFWWIAYCHRGREIRESSGSTDRRVAERLLRRRRQEVGADHLGLKPFVGPAQERVTFEDLAAAYLQDYAVRGLRSRQTAEARVKQLRRVFGTDRAADITPARLRAYQAARREEGAEAATINRELSALRRMFRLAVAAGRLPAIPAFPPPLEENPPRQGFFEHAEYLAIREHLPPHYQDVLDLAYWTGWRKQEILRLEWREVDLAGGVIRLSPARSKTKTGRVLPLSAPLREVLARRLEARRLDTPLVFHRDGQPIGDWRKSWARACQAAGLPGKRLHDCRRTVARNLVRAGVPERVAMAILGHQTRSIFDRYNIVSEADLRRATARLADYVAGQASERVVVPLPKASERSAP